MIAAVTLLALSFRQDPGADVLFVKSKLTCKDWAQVANSYIDLGADRAAQSLVDSLATHRGKKANTRAGLICRILFTSKSPLRAPKFGDLSLPPLSLSSWPQFPFAEQDGVWFLLDENYRPTLDGDSKGELARAYIDYCQRNGQFRTEKLVVPTKQQAVDALGALQASKRFKGIHWSDYDLHSSYKYDKDWTLELLRSQTNFSDGE